MNSIAQIAYYALIIIFSFVLGFGYVLLSKREQENWFPKSFIYGTAILMVISYWVSYFCKKGFDKFAVPIVVVLFVGVIFVYVVRRRLLFEYIKKITKGDVLSFFICFAFSALPLLLVIIFGAQYPFCDGYTYVCNADYLMEHGYRVEINPEDTIMHPWLSQTLLYQVSHFRIGAQMLLAFFSSVFRVKFSLEVFLPMTSYGVFLWGMGAWNFVTKKITTNRYSRIFAIVFVTGNVPVVLWNAVYGFLPQTFGSAFFIAAIAGIFSFEEWKEDKNWHIFITAILFSCEALAYNEMLPFLLLVTALYMIRYLLLHKEEWKKTICYISSCAVLAMIAIITYIPGMIHAILTMFGGVVGWHQEKDLVTYIAYFLSSVPANYSFMTAKYSMLMYAFEVFTLALGIVTVLGYIRSDNGNKKDFILVSFPYLLMFTYFCFFTENPFVEGKGNSWSIYKLMQYYFVMAIPFISLFISNALEKAKKMVVIGFVVLFGSFNICSILVYETTLAASMEQFVGNIEKPINAYYSLYERYGDSKEIITLYNVPQKHRQMVTYFLQDVQLLSDWESDGYYSIIPENPKDLYGSGINLVYDISAKENTAGLVEREIDITLNSGFYDTESDGNTYWNWSKKESELSIARYTTGGACTISFDMFGTNQKENSVAIYTDAGILLQKVELIPNQRTAVTILVDEDIDAIRFEFVGEVIAQDNDPRELAFAIANYSVAKR